MRDDAPETVPDWLSDEDRAAAIARMGDIDRVTGQPADAYTPPEDRVTATEFAALQVEADRAEREENARPRVPRRRRPDETEVYVLGHYEQMLVAKAILFAGNRSVDLTATERKDIRILSYIFADPGTVTILREPDSE